MRVDHSDDEEGPHVFSGDSTLYGADLTIKHYFNSYSFLTLQSEYLNRKMEGILYKNNDAGNFIAPDLTKEQSGLYTQLIYGLNKDWQIGVRYDTINKNDVVVNGVNQNQPSDLNKYSAMIEYHTSEFARFRLQYNRNNALYEEDEKQSVNTIILQANISIGAHGAHSF